MNDLKTIGITKIPIDIMNKFSDSLPSKWETSIDIIRDTGHIKTLTLKSLYASLLCKEQNKIQN